MKKIININLSGRVIPIEDSAYEKLQGYVESLRRYFANEEGRDEIINDIESRIAELMNDRVQKGAGAITEDDVEGIINSMGRVEDFEAADQEAAAAGAAAGAAPGAGTESASATASAPRESYTERKPRGRLYRDTNDRFLGGVCSGISNYTNVDPSIVRLIFGILGLATGLGILAYIVLWIVLPPRELDPFTGKKLYRNPDDRIIGGVAGGLAAYFNAKASTLRLIFAAPLLLNILIGLLNGFSWHRGPNVFLNIGVGSLTGTFILAYIILWIVLPEASTEYEKMEMRGETVDINRIRENVKAGMQNMKSRMQSWGEEVKSSAKEFGNRAKEFADTRGREFAAEVQETTRRRRRGLGHAIGVVFKVFFLFIGGIIAFSLFVALIALLFGGVAWWPVNNFLWTSSWQQVLAWCTLIFFFVVPLVAFIVWIVRRVMRARSRNNYLGWTFGGLWTLGWIVMMLFLASLFRDFRSYRSEDTPLNVQQPANGKMVVTVLQPELAFTGDFGWMSNGDQGWDISDDTMRFAAARIHVVASVDDQYRVTLKKFSFGRNSADADRRASHIQYSVVSRDSLLDLGNAYSIGRQDKFRGQNVEVEIQVPVGKKIRFDASVEEKLNLIHVRVNRSLRNKGINIEIDNNEDAFRYKPGIDYVMGAGGELLDGGQPVPAKPSPDYKYPGPDTLRNSIPRQVEENMKKIEQLKKENDQLQEKLKEKPAGISRALDHAAPGNAQDLVDATGPLSQLISM